MAVIRDPQAQYILSLLRSVSIRRKNKQKEFIALVHPCIHEQYDVILHTDEHKKGIFHTKYGFSAAEQLDWKNVGSK